MLFGLVKIIEIVKTIIKEVRLNIRLKLLLIKTPSIKMEKIDKVKKISGSIMLKLSIIFNLKLVLTHNYLLSYQLIHQMFPLMEEDKNQKKELKMPKKLTSQFQIY